MCGKDIVQLGLWDTAGQEEYNRLRPLSYPGTDVFLVWWESNHSQYSFSVAHPDSFLNVKHKWVRELEMHCPTGRLLLVGLKSDLRGNQEMENFLASKGRTMVTESEGRALAAELSTPHNPP